MQFPSILFCILGSSLILAYNNPPLNNREDKLVEKVAHRVSLGSLKKANSCYRRLLRINPDNYSPHPLPDNAADFKVIHDLISINTMRQNLETNYDQLKGKILEFKNLPLGCMNILKSLLSNYLRSVLNLKDKEATFAKRLLLELGEPFYITTKVLKVISLENSIFDHFFNLVEKMDVDAIESCFSYLYENFGMVGYAYLIGSVRFHIRKLYSHINDEEFHNEIYDEYYVFHNIIQFSKLPQNLCNYSSVYPHIGRLISLNNSYLGINNPDYEVIFEIADSIFKIKTQNKLSNIIYSPDSLSLAVLDVKWLTNDIENYIELILSTNQFININYLGMVKLISDPSLQVKFLDSLEPPYDWFESIPAENILDHYFLLLISNEDYPMIFNFLKTKRPDLFDQLISSYSERKMQLRFKPILYFSWVPNNDDSIIFDGYCYASLRSIKEDQLRAAQNYGLLEYFAIKRMINVYKSI